MIVHGVTSVNCWTWKPKQGSWIGDFKWSNTQEKLFMENISTLPETKTFIWSMFGTELIQKFERFNKLALVDGIHVTKLLSSLIEEHIQNNDIQGTLVDERQLLENLQAVNLSISRVTLRNYRIQGKLEKDGKPFWFTDGRNICYHWEHCFEFFNLRRRKTQKSGSLTLNT